MGANISQQLNIEKLQKIINNPLVYRQEFLILLFIGVTLVLILVVFFSLLVLRSPRVKVKWQTVGAKKSVIPVSVLFLIFSLIFLVLFIPTSGYLASDRFCLSCHQFSNWNQFSHKKQGCHSCHIRFGWFGALANNVGMSAKLLNKYVTVGKVNTPVYETNCWQCHQNKVTQILVKNGKKIRHKNLLDFSCLACHKELRHK